MEPDRRLDLLEAVREARYGRIIEEPKARAVVTDPDIARRILAALPTMARAPPLIDSAVVYEPALA